MTSLYDISIPVLKNILATEQDLLANAEAFATEKGTPISELLSTRLHEDMLPLSIQVVLTVNSSRKAIERLTGTPCPGYETKETELEGCRVFIADTLKVLDDIKPETVNGKETTTVTCVLPFKEFPMIAIDYIQRYTIPNAYFHLNTMYGILRMKGVQLGKAMYLDRYIGDEIRNA